MIAPIGRGFELLLSVPSLHSDTRFDLVNEYFAVHFFGMIEPSRGYVV